MMAEKRSATRYDPSVSLDALFMMVRKIDDDLTTKLEPLIAAQFSIMDSLPRDETGQPSVFVHRLQHQDQTNAYKTKKNFFDGLKTETGRLFIIITVVILANVFTSRAVVDALVSLIARIG